MKIKFTLIVYLLALITYSQNVTSQSWSDSVDKAIEKFAIEDGPGGVVSVAKGNQILYTKPFGFSNVNKQILNTSNTLFDIASCSKQFTAASILILAEQGRIDLQKPLQYYFPELKIKTPIPLYSLLTHTSGLNDYSEILLLARGRGGESIYKKKEILNIIFNQTTLGFNSLYRDNYSNTNYALLAELVEKISQQPFPEFLKENIFKPLNISSQEIRIGDNYSDQNVDLSTGYLKRRKDELSFIPETESKEKAERIYGDGGIRANIFGLTKWMANYKLGKLSNDKLLIKALLVKDTLSNGELSQYARGLVSGTTKSGHKWVKHTGRGLYGTSIMLWIPEFDISIIGLFNTDEIWAQSVTNNFLMDIIDSFEDNNSTDIDKNEIKNSDNEKSDPNIIPQPEILLSDNELKKFIGLYPGGAPVGSHVPPSGGVGVDKIVLDKGKLQYILYNGYAIDLKPISNTILEMTGVGRPIQLIFSDIESERPGIVAADPTVNDGKPSEDIAYRLSKLNSSEAKLFCGKYKSPTITKSIPIEILFEDDKLYMQWGILKKKSQLYYLGDDVLTSWKDGKYAMQCNLVFKRNANGDVTGFTYDGHRVWNLFFKKG